MINDILQFKNFPIIVAFLSALVMFVFVFVIIKTSQSKKRIEENFINQIDLLSGGGERTKKDSLFDRWDKYITVRLRIMGIAKYDNYNNQIIGKRTLVFFLLIYTICSFLFKNLGFGVVPVVIILAVIHFRTANTIKGNVSAINEQVGGFISIFKSNLQSGDSSENALMKAIQKTKSPLRNELDSVALMIETGSFQQALKILKTTTNNENLVFLCNGIEIAMNTGSNLEEYITVIEEMIEKKNEIKRKLDIAVAENMPLVYLSMALIPFLFIFMYLTNQQARDFWFNDIISWVVFGSIIGIYGLGLFLSNKVIKNVDKF